MYIGYIDADIIQSYNLIEGGFENIYKNMTPAVIEAGISKGLITQMPLEKKGKTQYPSLPEDTVSVFLIPYSSALNVYKDNGIGGIVPFSHPDLNVNGEKIITIGNEAYKVYGEYESGNVFMGDNSGEKYYYINQ